MNKKRILVATTLTKGRDAAFNRALSLARVSGAELYLLHAVPATQPFSIRAEERLERRAELQHRAEQAGVAVQAVEQQGDPAEIIKLHADARGVDLIVIGAHGNTPSRWRRRRSVVDRVLRRTTKPTLVVPSRADAEFTFENVLVAVDLTPASEDLIRQALQLASSESSRITVLHAADSIEPAGAVQNLARWMVPEYRTHVLADAKHRLESILTRVPKAVDARAQIAAGPVVRAITEEATARKADLVVVGRSHRFRPLGSTATNLPHDHNRALLVVPVSEALSGADAPTEHRRAA